MPTIPFTGSLFAAALSSEAGRAGGVFVLFVLGAARSLHADLMLRVPLLVRAS